MHALLRKKYKFFITIFLVCLFLLTTLISVGFSALNQDLSISGDIEYEQDLGNVLMRWKEGDTTDFHSDTYKTKVKTVSFLDSIDIPVNAIESWDVSEQGTGRVMAWIIEDTDQAGFYNVYIGADTDIIANKASSYIFEGFTALEHIYFNDNYDTSGVTSMNHMFENCSSLESLDLSGFDTSQVTGMISTFSGCESLISIDLTGVVTANVKNMSGLFNGCQNLQQLDLSGFNTSQVTSMNHMFENCSSLERLDLSNFDTSQVTGMILTFSGCENLISINLTGVVTTNVTNMGGLFIGCQNISYLDLSSFNTSQVTNMSKMFADCSRLITVELSSFDTSQVTDMSNMFLNCTAITYLNLSSFDTSSVKNFGAMFKDSSNLHTIIISNLWNTSSASSEYGAWMFYGCTSLPNFDPTKINVSMAKPTYQGGYLTLF